jgi:hypothetical protein
MKTKAQVISWLETNPKRVILVEISGVLDGSGNPLSTFYLSNRPYGSSLLAAGYSASSTTSNTVGIGSKTFTIQTAKSFIAGEQVLITSGANQLTAFVSSYSGSTLVVDVVATTGSGTYASWTVQLLVPENQMYTAGIAGGVTFSESLDFSGQPNIGYGDIELDNTNGVRDTWLTYIWVNKPIVVWIGDPGWARSDFYPIFRGMVRDIDSKSRNSLNLILVNELQVINEAISTATMTGSGTSADKLVPLCFGECFNITPAVKNSATLQYQVHNGPIETVLEVRDNGAPVPFTQTVADGTFQLQYSPFGTITATVQGAKPNATYVNKIGSVIKTVLRNYGKQLLTSDVDEAGMDAVDTATNYEVGVYLDARENVLDLCQRIAISGGYYLVPDITGKLKLVRMIADIVSAATYTVKPSDMEFQSLSISQKLDVLGTVKLGYSKNWTPQTSGLASVLKPEALAVLEKPYYYEIATDATVVSRYQQVAEPVAQETLLISQADATTEATRLLTIKKQPRFVYTATYYAKMLFCELGDTVQITHPRFGLSAGKTGMAVSVNRDWLNGKVSIGVFI